MGKSTLLNYIVGQKVSIVSNKPQTTRRKVVGISTTPEYQIAFIDTPGIHDPHTRLGRTMVEQARAALGEVDLVVYVADGAHHPGEMDEQIAHLIAPRPKKGEEDVVAAPRFPLVLCLNKMDLLKAEDVQRNVDAYMDLFGTHEYMLTTATRGNNVPKLVDLIVSKLPERAPMYDEDEFTDQSSRFMVSEFVREKILFATRQEIPHSVAVLIEDWDQQENILRISADILVEKQSQRAIIIGKQGQFLKNIGTLARADIEALLGTKVFLQLHVKVSEGWRQNPRVLHELDYD